MRKARVTAFAKAQTAQNGEVGVTQGDAIERGGTIGVVEPTTSRLNKGEAVGGDVLIYIAAAKGAIEERRIALHHLRLLD